MNDGKPVRKGFWARHKGVCIVGIVIMVLVIGTMCAYIISVAIGNPIQDDPSDPSENEVPSYDFPFMTRADWSARPPTQVTRLQTPVPYVVIHHSYQPRACYNNAACGQAMRSMQNYHMDSNGWWDIGYNFAVGSNGVAFEGRGWTILGAHALHFNTVSIGICLIGDWTSALPPVEQMKTAQKLIEAGVELGFVDPQYKLVGHRQVRPTECPGDALFEEIKSWSHFSPFPSTDQDLVYVEELPLTLREELKRNFTIENMKNAPVTQIN